MLLLLLTQGCIESSETSTESASTNPPTVIPTNFTDSKTQSTIPTTTPSPRVKVEVASDQLELKIEGLHHFSDYTILVKEHLCLQESSNCLTFLS